MNRTNRPVGVLLGLVLATAGCSSPGDDDAAPTPTATAVATQTPSPTPSPTPTKEPEPEPGPDFERTDERGAEAAAVYFAEVVYYTIRTGDETVLDRIQNAETCLFCSDIRVVARDTHETSASVQGGHTAITVLKTYAFDETNNGYPLDVRVVQDEARLFDHNGNIVEVVSSGESDLRVEVAHDGSMWKLLNIIPLEDIR